MSKEHYEDEEDLTQVRNIIKQLNEKPAQERKREVVTRPDGTKVVRVTKRRKRMLTEMDKKKRSRKSFVIGLLVVFLIACVATAFFFWRMVSMGSESYITQKQEEWCKVWGASTLTVTGAGVDGNKLHLDVVEAEFPETSMIRRIRMTNVEAVLSSQTFLSSTIQAELLKIGNLDIVLKDGAKHLEIPQASQEAFWAFRRVECDNFNLSLERDGASPVSIRNTRAYMYYPRSNKSTSVVILNDGTLHLKGWQNMRILDAKITISPSAIEDFIIQTTTNEEDNPAEELRTSIAFYGKMMDGGELAGPYLMDSVNIPLADFTDGRFDHFFSARTKTSLRGRKHAKAQVVLPLEADAPVFSGEMSLSNVCLTGFPVLMQMAEHIDPRERRAYMPVRMNRAVVKISHDQDGIQLEIPADSMVERDLIHVHGTMKVGTDNNLSGKLECALPSILTRVEYPDGMSDPLFREMGEWAWVVTELRGQANRPDDNSAELEARAADARKSRPARIPFNQIDLERMLQEIEQNEEPFKDKPLEIGPSQQNSKSNPFEQNDNPFAK